MEIVIETRMPDTRHGKKVVIAIAVMLLTIIVSEVVPTGDARLAVLFLHLIALGCALWFYAKAKGYIGHLGLLLIPIFWFGLLILAWLPDKTADAEKPPSIGPTLTGAALLFFVDAIWMNQGGISAILGLAILFVAIPMALFGRERALRAYKLKKSAIWLVAVICVFAFNWASNQMARHRANDVIVAVKAYHQQHGAYPKRLDDLIPVFLPSVPRAKYVLGLGEFKYLYDEARPTLFYVEFPPFGRPTFSFGRDEWDYID
ncbi:MAG: hypothetical protein Q8L39_05115 [Burkholderiales bacterium]|nr:hypothetical protein [Burkholderiales bacterium]